MHPLIHTDNMLVFRHSWIPELQTLLEASPGLRWSLFSASILRYHGLASLIVLLHRGRSHSQKVTAEGPLSALSTAGLLPFFPKVGACPLDGREQVTCSAASSEPCAEVCSKPWEASFQQLAKKMGHLAHSHEWALLWNWDSQPQQSFVWCSPNCRDSAWIVSQVFLHTWHTQKLWILTKCFKLLSFRVICYAAVNH